MTPAMAHALPHFADGTEIDPRKIALRLRIVKSDTAESDT
jgi:hypothetical protein